MKDEIDIGNHKSGISLDIMLRVVLVFNSAEYQSLSVTPNFL